MIEKTGTFPGIPKHENRGGGGTQGVGCELYHMKEEEERRANARVTIVIVVFVYNPRRQTRARVLRGPTPRPHAGRPTRDVLVRSVPRFSFSSITIWRGIPCHLRRRMARTRRPWPRQPTARPKRGPRRRHASRPGHPRSPIVWCVQQRGKVRWMGGEATRRWVPDDEP